MNRVILIAGLMIGLMNAGCAELAGYIEPMFKGQTVPPDYGGGGGGGGGDTGSTQVESSYVNTDGNFALDRYNEDAFVEYRDGLRDGVKMITVLGNPQMANPYFVKQLRIQLNTSIIEIAQWPPDARNTAWQSMGGEIDALTQLFEEERDVLANDERYSEDFRREIARIRLLERD